MHIYFQVSRFELGLKYVYKDNKVHIILLALHFR